MFDSLIELNALTLVRGIIMSGPEGVVAGGTGGLDGLMAAAQGALQDSQIAAATPTPQPTGGVDTAPNVGNNGDTSALVDMATTGVSRFSGAAIAVAGIMSEDTSSKFTTSPTDIGKGQSKNVKGIMPSTYESRVAATKPTGSYSEMRKAVKIANKNSGKRPAPKNASVDVMSKEERVMGINTTSMSLGAGSHVPKGISANAGISASAANLYIENIKAGIQKEKDLGHTVVPGAALLSKSAYTALKGGSDKVAKKADNAPRIQPPVPNAPSPKAPVAA